MHEDGETEPVISEVPDTLRWAFEVDEPYAESELGKGYEGEQDNGGEHGRVVESLHPSGAALVADNGANDANAYDGWKNW